MKKLLTILMVSLFTLTAFTQDVKSTTCFLQTGKWNSYKEDYVYGKIKFEKIDFLFRGNVIIVNDYAESTYITSNSQKFSDGSVLWDAIDENNKMCKVVMYDELGYTVVEIMYVNVSYKYFFDPNE